MSPDDKIKLLEKALDGYRNVIIYQQGQLSRQVKQRGDYERRIQALETQLKRLQQAR